MSGVKDILYKLGRALYAILFYTVFRLKIEGLHNVPKEGGVLLVANHVSLLDPPLVGVAMKRPVHFMAKAELFDMFFLKWALPKINVFPVKRGAADRRAIRLAIELLQEGRVVCLFPEGTRSKTGQLLPAQRGAGLIAIRAGVPIVPVGLTGTYKQVERRWPFFKRIKVKYGPPIYPDQLTGTEEGDDFDRLKQLETVNKTMMEAVASLIDR